MLKSEQCTYLGDYELLVSLQQDTCSRVQYTALLNRRVTSGTHDSYHWQTSKMNAVFWSRILAVNIGLIRCGEADILVTTTIMVAEVANQSNSGLQHSSTLGARVCRTG